MTGLVILNIVAELAAVGVVAMGTYLILHGHGVAGGWIAAFGIVCLLLGGYSTRKD